MAMASWSAGLPVVSIPATARYAPDQDDPTHRPLRRISTGLHLVRRVHIRHIRKFAHACKRLPVCSVRSRPSRACLFRPPACHAFLGRFQEALQRASRRTVGRPIGRSAGGKKEEQGPVERAFFFICLLFFFFLCFRLKHVLQRNATLHRPTATGLF